MATGAGRTLVAAAVALLLFPLPVAAGQDGPTDAERVAVALAWVASQQAADGRWPLPAQGYPTEAAAAAGVDPKLWPSPASSAFAALSPESCSWKVIPSEQQDCVYKSLLRITHAAGVAGYDPRAIHGRDAVAEVRAGYVGGQFGGATFINDDMWAVLALRAAGVPRDDIQLRSAVEVIKAARASDGGWSSSSVAAAGNVDMTGMALAALAAMGEPTAADAQAKAFLARMADPTTGGYRSMANSDPSCQSTSWGLHAEHALGMPSNQAALRFLRSLQRANGGFAMNPGDAGPNLFCTVEAIVVLSGARFPLPGYAPAPEPRWVIHAGEPVTLPVPSPFTTVTLESIDPSFERRDVLAFPKAGEYHYRALAEGNSVASRWQGTLQVLSARPVLPELPLEIRTLRGSDVTLDLTSARDPDGHVARIDIDWGDGNRTTLDAPGPASHAYAAPGLRDVTIHARDDAGVASHATALVVEVANRAPLFAPLPARVTADRIAPLRLAAHATDPDGDPVQVTWRVANASGQGAAESLLPTLGNHTLRFEAEDAFGGRGAAHVTVEVVNLPPALANVTLPSRWAADATFAFSADASDADGPTPRVAWRIGNLTRDGPRGEATLPAGEHEVEVAAFDIDGASTIVRARVLVDAAAPPAPERAKTTPATPPPEAAKTPVPPPLPAPRFVPVGGFAVGEPARVAVSTVDGAAAYRFEFGDGSETSWDASPEATHAWMRPGSYEVRAWARASEDRTSMQAIAIRVAPRTHEPPAAAAPAAARTPAEPAEPLSPIEEIVELRPQGSPMEREVPAPLPLVAVGLALLLARRGRRAP